MTEKYLPFPERCLKHRIETNTDALVYTMNEQGNGFKYEKFGDMWFNFSLLKKKIGVLFRVLESLVQTLPASLPLQLFAFS
jgi:hypothetical protein